MVLFFHLPSSPFLLCRFSDLPNVFDPPSQVSSACPSYPPASPSHSPLPSLSPFLSSFAAPLSLPPGTSLTVHPSSFSPANSRMGTAFALEAKSGAWPAEGRRQRKKEVELVEIRVGREAHFLKAGLRLAGVELEGVVVERHD